MTSTAPVAPGGRRWAILAVIAVAQLMVVLDNTIVNIALPSAQVDLGFDDAQRQWVITAYALAFGSLLLLGGRMSDLFGRKRAFVTGLIGFAVASMVGGAATDLVMLVTARAAQGVFGALLAPAALSLLTTTFPGGRERARAFGIFSAIVGAGAAIGLLLGGVLTEYVDWRWCMYVNAVFAVVALVGGLILLPSMQRRGRPQLDVGGTLAASAGLFGLVFGLASAETDGWSSPVVWAFLAAGVVLLGVFVLIQRRVSAPLLPLRVILDRTRGGAYLTVLVLASGMFGVSLFLTFYLQRNLGFSPVLTGVAFLPMVASIVTASTTVPNALLPRLGPKPLVITGLVLGTSAMLWFSQLTVDSTYVVGVLPGLVLMGLGMGTAMSTGINTATLGVQPADAGVASATVNTMQQVGGSVGTALLSSIAGTATAAALTTAPGDPGAATVSGYSAAFTAAAILFAVGAVVCGLLVRGGRPQSATTTETTATTEATASTDSTGLVGAVRDAGGGAVAGATLTLVDPAGRESGRAVSDAEGDFDLRAAGPGDHLLVTGAPGLAPSAQRIVLADGRTTRGDVVLDLVEEPART
ncbi:EmrB/QacA subfamily drug resistance transporter [Actinomycetospora succinea]|uniref:EmrB/QacA subfamily drug resistance transporter n=1 Tax=Actinomycetospora succinea TaxID=663603 RepID=A0A4R6V1C8_9PSEU|nr:EmrB/QacA subfamily drug resistance transporter [Actinomycetospora succinea]